MAPIDGGASPYCILGRDAVGQVMAARTKSKVTPKYKTKYRVRNWPTSEAALRRRGDVTLWFDEDAVDAWNAGPSGRPGGQRKYCDLAIVAALTLRVVFHLPLRQTEGFVASLIRLMGLDLETPDHTTLSRRNSKRVAVSNGVLDEAPQLRKASSVYTRGPFRVQASKLSNSGCPGPRARRTLHRFR